MRADFKEGCMELTSGLYQCRVMHCRVTPKKHLFHYSLFLFYLDLDEINELAGKYLLLGKNRFNAFSFYDRDYFKEKPGETLKEKVAGYLRSQGIELGDGKIMLLTHLRTMGYLFNPVSFYFCFGKDGDPVCAIAEVTNTFREMKLYLLKKKRDGIFEEKHEKLFYVSPFIDMDVWFDFRVKIPGKKLDIHIDDFRNGEKFFFSSLAGEQKPITGKRLMGYACRYPLITFKVIVLIHWQALRLWLKGVGYHKKNANRHLQRDVINHAKNRR